MKKCVLFICVILFSTSISAQETKEEKAIKKVLEVFFEALHKGDSSQMKSTFHKDIKIQTTATNKEGKNILNTVSKEQLLTSVANKNPNHIYLEKLLSLSVKTDGNLASVWTPYEFYLNDNFSHCGSNSFQLFDNNGKWEIIFLVDIRRRENCSALEAKN